MGESGLQALLLSQRAFLRRPKAELPADLATLRNRLTELEWAEGGEKKCRFKT